MAGAASIAAGILNTDGTGSHLELVSFSLGITAVALFHADGVGHLAEVRRLGMFLDEASTPTVVPWLAATEAAGVLGVTGTW